MKVNVVHSKLSANYRRPVRQWEKRDRWWRAAYVLTLLAMVTGASAFEWTATYSPALRAASLVILALTTFVSTRNERASLTTLGKLVIGALWGTGLIGLASSAWSEFPQSTAIYSFTFMLLVYILHRTCSVRWQSRARAEGDLTAGYLAMIVVISAGLVLAFLGHPNVTSWAYRHQGLFNNPNLLGMLAAITFTLGLAVAIRKKSIMFWFLLAIPAVAVTLSGSRTAVTALAISIAWVLLRRGGVPAVVGAFGVALALLALGVGEMRLFSKVFSRFESNDGRDLLNSRSLAWEEAFRVLQVKPLGVGFGSTAEAIDVYATNGLFIDGLTSIHNSYIQIMFEVGWIGIALSLLFVFIFTSIAFRSSVRGFSCGLVATVVAGMLIQITESAIFGIGQPYPYLFWLVVMALTLKREGGATAAARAEERSVNVFNSSPP